MSADTLPNQREAILAVWRTQCSAIRTDDLSINMLVAQHPEHNLASRADTIFHHICDVFDQRCPLLEARDAIWKTYPNPQDAPPEAERQRTDLSKRMMALDEQLRLYVLQQITDLRPALANQADLFVGKVIKASVLAYAEITHHAIGVQGKESANVPQSYY